MTVGREFAFSYGHVHKLGIAMNCGEDRNDQEPKHQWERHIAPKPMDSAASDAPNKSGSWDAPGDKKKLMPFQSRKKASHQWKSGRKSTLRRIVCERLRK
ncbi:Hypothetical predicted protein [Paramuricea clavata]|uniref:Uncharacterized protein n=1 Tax=Paramuricea clavata TaxID=317549 RepID=A0A7D9J1A3_PARCT|nr:Hypothetical predicted protein [Paramuricea clavata]